MLIEAAAAAAVVTAAAEFCLAVDIPNQLFLTAGDTRHVRS